jgi:hypothetical protein
MPPKKKAPPAWKASTKGATAQGKDGDGRQATKRPREPNVCPVEVFVGFRQLTSFEHRVGTLLTDQLLPLRLLETKTTRGRGALLTDPVVRRQTTIPVTSRSQRSHDIRQRK